MAANKSASSLRILHLVHDSRRTGVQMLASNLVRELVACGQHCSVFFARKGALAEKLAEEQINVLTGDCFPAGILWRLNRFFTIFRLLGFVGQYDLLHIHSLKMAHLVPIAKLLGFKVVFHVHELTSQFGLTTKAALKRADATIFNSKACFKFYNTLPTRKPVLLVNGIPLPQERTHFNETKTCKIIEVASINKGKGQDILLQAFKRLNGKNLRLLFFGPVSIPRKFYDDLKAAVISENLEKNVLFMGETTEPLAEIARADIVVQPSRQESFGLVVVEAMALGKPVVAHDVGGMREIVVNGETGFLVPVGDVRALSGRIQELVDDPQLREKMGEAGRVRVLENFDISKKAIECIELYDSL